MADACKDFDGVFLHFHSGASTVAALPTSKVNIYCLFIYGCAVWNAAYYSGETLAV